MFADAFHLACFSAPSHTYRAYDVVKQVHEPGGTCHLYYAMKPFYHNNTMIGDHEGSPHHLSIFRNGSARRPLP